MALENIERDYLYEHIPCQILENIDKLWAKYSNGKFGFSVQKEIYEAIVWSKYKISNRDINNFYFRLDVWEHFQTIDVQWYRFMGGCLGYNLHIFGHLPRCAWSITRDECFGALLSRC